jgi:hypothetical protein
MAWRQFCGQHAFALINKMVAFDDWYLMPTAPVDFAVPHENRIKAYLVERDVGAGMP